VPCVNVVCKERKETLLEQQHQLRCNKKPVDGCSCFSLLSSVLSSVR